MQLTLRAFIVAVFVSLSLPSRPAAAAESFTGRYFSGEGDVEYLQLLDVARRMYDADAEYQNMAMLYNPQWNGLVEGPTFLATAALDPIRIPAPPRGTAAPSPEV